MTQAHVRVLAVALPAAPGFASALTDRFGARRGIYAVDVPTEYKATIRRLKDSSDCTPNRIRRCTLASVDRRAI